MKVEQILVGAISVSPWHRECDDEVIAGIATSMKLVGQLQPVVVFDSRGDIQLVAGRHRLEAARALGWERIAAAFVTGDGVDQRLCEISENLHRAELTVQERADQISEWVDLMEQKRVLRQVDAKPQGGRPEGGMRKAARDLNLSEPEVRRAKRIASITPEAKADAKKAGIDDNQSKLLAVANAPAAAQVAKVAELAVVRARRPSGATSTATSLAAAQKVVTGTRADVLKSIEDEVDPENYLTAYLLRVDQAIRFAAYSGPMTEEIVLKPAELPLLGTSWRKNFHHLELPPPPIRSMDQGWRVGQACSHRTFGRGKVTEVTGDTLTILFDAVGKKRVVDRFVSPSAQHSEPPSSDYGVIPTFLQRGHPDCVIAGAEVDRRRG